MSACWAADPLFAAWEPHRQEGDDRVWRAHVPLHGLALKARSRRRMQRGHHGQNVPASGAQEMTPFARNYREHVCVTWEASCPAPPGRIRSQL